MNSFLDMAPATARTVVVGEASYPVPGIKLKALAYLIKRYWDALAPLVTKWREVAEAKQKVVASGAEIIADGSDQAMLADILALPDDIIAAMIAAGMGHLGSEAAEAIADRLSAGTQAALLAEIVQETMPDGIVPFVENGVKLFAAIAKEKAAAAANQATRTPSRPSRKQSTT